MYTGILNDPAFFASEQESLENEISRLEGERDKAMSVAKDWKNVANDAFMSARYAKEDFDSDDQERKRAVIKRLGADLKLADRTTVFTSVKFLVPVTETKEFLKAKKRRLEPLQNRFKRPRREGK